MKGRGNEHKRFIWFCLYAFGVPAIIITLTLSVDFTDLISEKYRPQFGYESCWIKDDKLVEGIFVIAPISIIIIFNVVLYSVTAFKINRVQQETKVVRKGESQKHSKDQADKARYFFNLINCLLCSYTKH